VKFILHYSAFHTKCRAFTDTMEVFPTCTSQSSDSGLFFKLFFGRGREAPKL